MKVAGVAEAYAGIIDDPLYGPVNVMEFSPLAKAKLDVQKYSDLSIVQEAAARLK